MPEILHRVAMKNFVQFSKIDILVKSIEFIRKEILTLELVLDFSL